MHFVDIRPDAVMASDVRPESANFTCGAVEQTEITPTAITVIAAPSVYYWLHGKLMKDFIWRDIKGLERFGPNTIRPRPETVSANLALAERPSCIWADSVQALSKLEVSGGAK